MLGPGPGCIVCLLFLHLDEQSWMQQVEAETKPQAAHIGGSSFPGWNEIEVLSGWEYELDASQESLAPAFFFELIQASDVDFSGDACILKHEELKLTMRKILRYQDDSSYTRIVGRWKRC